MMDKYGYRIPVDSLRHYILRWLGLEGVDMKIATSCAMAKKFAVEQVGILNNSLGEKVREEITVLRSSPKRHVACPSCGNGFDLSGHDLNVHSITIICNKCSTHFEVRPSLFWNKIEVEKR